MASNEILKTIKINVNSSEYKALLKSTQELAKLEKEINKLNEKDADIFEKKIQGVGAFPDEMHVLHFVSAAVVEPYTVLDRAVIKSAWRLMTRKKIKRRACPSLRQGRAVL